MLMIYADIHDGDCAVIGIPCSNVCRVRLNLSRVTETQQSSPYIFLLLRFKSKVPLRRIQIQVHMYYSHHAFEVLSTRLLTVLLS